MRLYLDTEFTDLTPDAKLISIGVVAENGKEFYAEFSNTYELKDCSTFVKNVVLPLLNGKKETYYEASLRFGNWIDDFEEECIFACDMGASWDIPFAKKMLVAYPPANLNFNLMFPVVLQDYVKSDLYDHYGYKIHNALDDARVMRLGVRWQEGYPL